MSRGRAGSYNEYYSPPSLYFQEQYKRSCPSTSFPRTGPELQPKPLHHYNSPGCLVASTQPHFPLDPCTHPFSPQKLGRSGSSSYQLQSCHSRHPIPHRGRGYYNQAHRFAGYVNQNQAQSRYRHPDSDWSVQTDALCDSFQTFSFDLNRPSSENKSFERISTLCVSSRPNDITLTPEIQDQVRWSLKPSKSISAKLLAKKLHLPKKIINQALYSLERSQKVFKQGLSPPEWTLNLRNRRVEEPQSYSFQKSKVRLETNSEVEDIGSDTETLSNCSSESPVLETFNSSQQHRHCCSGTSADHDFTMASMKEDILQNLLTLAPVSATMLAKNMNLRNPKQINSTLYSLEKTGEVVRNRDTNPQSWDLSDHQKERMMRTLKASKSAAIEEAVKVEKADLLPEQMKEEPPPPGPIKEEFLPLGESWLPKAEVMSSTPPKQPPLNRLQEEVAVEGQWASDDIPEYLNSIRNEANYEKPTNENANPVGTVAVSLAAPPAQNLWAKLQEVRQKNPVSGLMEYAQYLGHSCEFILLDQSGPSHDPRFRMQVMLNRRLFPVAEASAKKVAKKDAAAATLLILVAEMQAGGNEGSNSNLNETKGLLSNPGGSTQGSGGVFGGGTGVGTVEVMGMPDGPLQPLSRSLPGGKNPVSVLMEYSQHSGNPIEFIITGQVGPPHDPRFMYRVKVGENLFAEASAPSKKAARQLAAEEAVNELMADGRLQLNKPQLPLGSSSDSDSCGTCPSLPPLTADELRAAHEAGVGDLINHLNNNAVSGLLEYARARGFAAEIRLVGQSGSAHEPKFTYQAKLGGRWFPPVCASNKKQGKQEAADAALRVLIGEAERAARTGELLPAELPVSGSTLHDQIAMLSHQRFNALTTRIQHSLLGRKILATIIMRRGEGLGTVVSLGTGNRCVKGEELSLKGDTVNDGHAEIISRRGFVRFLYSELLKHFECTENSIFEPTEDGNLRIKSDITFHLYISTAPCGDGALFDKSCSETGEEVGGHQPLFENAKQGKLRTKVENGEGTIPVESSAIVPTWDGIQHGERLRTMSCSDKILRWNVLGLQGALLTHFLHPIYLKSITLGYLYSHGHLTRAVCCRLARDGEAFSQSLPPPFQLNHPEVGRVSVYDSTRHTGKTKESSVNWSLPDHTSVEVLDGTKGKQDGNKLGVSRVSKSNLFCLFRKLCQRCNRTDLLSMQSYTQAKKEAYSFQLAKHRFFQALGDHGYGAWIGKPLEEKSFEVGEERLSEPVAFDSSRNGGAMEYNQAEA
ncbi:double-stranded RNA-specific adenosine deaminase [Stigmatopora argus]